MSSYYSHFSSFICFTFLFSLNLLLPATNAAGGQWRLLQKNLGIVAMHMQLLHNDRVIIFDRTDFGASNLSLPDRKCRVDPHERALTTDCTAHSAEYDVATNSFRPLNVLTDVWCSSGAVTPDGTLIQTGGFSDGERVVRVFKPCDTTSSTCDWTELGNELLARRWYATNHILPNGKIIIIGGRQAFNYEFYPKSESSKNLYSFRFLVQTNDRRIENNLYPFVFLNVDGNLFIFANTQSILFDYTRNTVVRTYPEIPGSDPRCYPSTGSAVLLPLKTQDSAEVMVCGGAPKGAFTLASHGREFLDAVKTCGRIKITDPNPVWEMEIMPMSRVMGDMLLLPNGKVLIINGASNGVAGWEFGRNPVLEPVIYDPDAKTGSRFEIQTGSDIPRMYHSTAILLRDGRVLVGGSNPHMGYSFDGVNYPTELRLEAFSPAYLDARVDDLRPSVVFPADQSKIGYGDVVNVQFRVPGTVDPNQVEVTVLAPPFNTHSFSMNQRMLVLSAVGDLTALGKNVYQVSVTAPSSGNIAPKGFYLMFVVHQEIPSEGVWVQIQ